MTKKIRRKYNLKSIIISHLRKIFFYSPLRREALDKAKVGNLYKSNKNGKKYPINMVTVDHVKPVVDTSIGWVDWNTFIERLFCPVDNLQVISREEHKNKTLQESKNRNAKQRKSK